MNGLNKPERAGLSVCGTDCSACPLHGNMCIGCSEACGRVFHMPEGKPCPIYACCAEEHGFATCASCEQMPCGVWRGVRDPSYTDEQFQKSIDGRAAALRRLRER